MPARSRSVYRSESESMSQPRFFSRFWSCSSRAHACAGVILTPTPIVPYPREKGARRRTPGLVLPSCKNLEGGSSGARTLCSTNRKRLDPGEQRPGAPVEVATFAAHFVDGHHRPALRFNLCWRYGRWAKRAKACWPPVDRGLLVAQRPSFSTP